MMEEAQSSAQGSKIFTGKDGDALVFVLMPCSSKAAIRKLIEDHGGRLISSPNFPGAIRLTQNKSAVGYLHIDFIYECVRQNRLLNQDDYIITRGRQLPVKYTEGSGRTIYTLAEDQAIIDYVKAQSKENGPGTVNGNRIWKMMEKEKVTKHSWQSMRCRFLRYLKNTGPSFASNPVLSIASCKGADVPFVQPVRIPVRKNATHRSISTSSRENQNPCTSAETAQGAGMKTKTREISSDTSDMDESGTSIRKRPIRHFEKSSNDSNTQESHAVNRNSSRVTRNVGDESENYSTVNGSVGLKKTREEQGVSANSFIILNETASKPHIVNDNVIDAETNICNLSKQISNFYLHTDEGSKMLKIINFRCKMRDFMVDFKLDFMTAFKTIYFCNGSLEDSAHCLNAGTMRNGSLPWNFEDDQVLESDRDVPSFPSRMQNIISRRGADAVQNRLTFLGIPE